MDKGSKTRSLSGSYRLKVTPMRSQYLLIGTGKKASILPFGWPGKWRVRRYLLMLWKSFSGRIKLIANWLDVV